MLLLPLITLAVSLVADQDREVSPTVVGFSIEQDRWVEWSQSSFATNAFDNLRQRTGHSPHIRIGANSEDRTIYDSSVQVQSIFHIFLQQFILYVQLSIGIFPPSTAIVPYPEAVNLTVGDGFYQCVANLLPGSVVFVQYWPGLGTLYSILTSTCVPAGTHVSWGVNFGRNNITTAVLQAQSIIRAFSSPSITETGIILDFLEIGNEADIYSLHGARDRSTWNITEYINEFRA